MLQTKRFFFTIGIVLLLGAAAFGQTEQKRNKLGIGFQATAPSVGMSLKYDVTEMLNAQAAFAVFGDLTTYSIRCNIERKRPYHNAMLYLAYGGFDYDNNSDINARGAGAGFGLEWFLRKLPELGFGVDIGFVRYFHSGTKWDGYYTVRQDDYTTMTGGAGIHYYMK
ncbi:MAG: hypothetical protein OEM52_01690 [bacterium]|nr:hypothetical protein [bacterium]